MKNKREIILASASPRRREILGEMGAEFRIVVADTDENCGEKDPETLTMILAKKKGQAVYELLASRGEEKNTVIISADTVVACDGEILGKPRDRDDAIRMISMLSGKTHTVVTGVGVTVDGVTRTDRSVTYVTVDEIPEIEIERYVHSGDPMDKAGAYGIQGAFSKWIREIKGCYFGVVGLPTNTLNRFYFDCVGEYIGS